MDEAKAVFECLGEPCFECFLTIIEGFDESTTCESLAADEDFCPAIEGCVVECSTNDCTDTAKKIEECAEMNYPDADGNDEEPCPDLCKESEEDDNSSEVPAREYFWVLIAPIFVRPSPLNIMFISCFICA